MGPSRWLRDHLFVCILLPLLIVFVCTSYYRFMTAHDYLVSYQGKCDPAISSCFVECSDDACTQKDYYDKVQKYAPIIRAECGTDITGCVAAESCLPEDGPTCSITYCDPGTEGDKCAAHEAAPAGSGAATPAVSTTTAANP